MELHRLETFKDVPLASLLALHCAQRERELHNCIEQGRLQANAAFFDCQPQALVSIPVSFEERSETIHTALGEFEKQRLLGAPPFWLCLNCNGPTRDSTENIRGIVNNFSERYPDLPLTFFSREYVEGTPIGLIKKDTVDVGTQLLARLLPRHKELPEHFAIVNEDIDLTRFSRVFLQRLLGAIANGATFAQANQRHARSGGLLPNMDRVMFWYDLAVMYNPVGLSDTHNAMSLRQYILSGGLSAVDVQTEGINLQRHARRVFMHDFVIARPPGTFAVPSARRAYWYMENKVSPEMMWDDPFQTIAPYRSRSLEDFRDISTETADEMLRHLGRETNYFGPRRAMFDAVKWGLAQRRLKSLQQFGPPPYELEKTMLEWAEGRVDTIKQAGEFVLRQVTLGPKIR